MKYLKILRRKSRFDLNQVLEVERLPVKVKLILWFQYNIADLC